mmetsp:Transcript_99929/g.196259  ORF Transcript_99929/g.196259 Transcript_99929/m.196259 type:complete len:107 (+) Transcript_99929:1118-1438(+)
MLVLAVPARKFFINHLSHLLSQVIEAQELPKPTRALHLLMQSQSQLGVVRVTISSMCTWLAQEMQSTLNHQDHNTGNCGDIELEMCVWLVGMVMCVDKEFFWPGSL